MVQNSLGRPRGRPGSDRSIDRTPEYNTFIEKLTIFNNERGRVLQSEPVLGGKRLDLLKIYNWVVGAGGFLKVTTARAWRRIAESFILPSTCTNSAYILKQIYKRNLLEWEISEHPNLCGDKLGSLKSFPSLATRDSLPLSNSKTKYRTDSPRAGHTYGEFTPYPIGDLNNLSATPIHMTANGDHCVTYDRTIPHQTLAKSLITTPLRNDGFGNGTQGLRKDYFEDNQEPCQYSKFEADFSPYYNGPRFGEDDYLLGESWKNRITLSLMSQLPNEVDWAMNTLSIISCTKACRLSTLPGLLDALFEFISPFFDNLRLCINEENVPVTVHKCTKSEVPEYYNLENEGKNILCPSYSTSPSTIFSYSNSVYITREHCSVVFHVLRNLSILEENAQIMAKSSKLLKFVILAIALPPWTFYVAIKHHALDILDSIIEHTDPSFDCTNVAKILLDCINSGDHGLICLALSSLSKLIHKHNLPGVLRPGSQKLQKIINTCVKFLLIQDESLVIGALDVLYEYSCLGHEYVDTILSVAKSYCLPVRLLKLFKIQNKNENHDINDSNIDKSKHTSTPHATETYQPEEQSPLKYLCKWNLNSNTNKPDINYLPCSAAFQSQDLVFQHLQRVHLAHIFMQRDVHISQSIDALFNSCACYWELCSWKVSNFKSSYPEYEMWSESSFDERAETYNSIVWKLIMHLATHFKKKQPSKFTKPPLLESQPLSDNNLDVSQNFKLTQQAVCQDDPLKSPPIPRTALFLMLNLTKFAKDKSVFLIVERAIIENMLSDFLLTKEISIILSEL